MSIFGSIMSKIFHPGITAGEGAAPVATTVADTAPAPAPTTSASPASPADSPTSPAAASQPVDVEAVLTQMADQKGGSGNWQTSIVDLLKLLDLDASLNSRKELANELNVHVGADGTAEQNIALHKAVMQKLADNGGKVPDSLKG